MTTDEILNADAHSEEFMTHFHAVLTKFVEEYDDMAHMTAINQAKALLDTINDN